MARGGWKQQIPWCMAGARAALGPVLIFGQRAGWRGSALAALVVVALLSDIFDGVLARHWNCDTDGVRLFDSMADTVFYAGGAVALWMRQAPLLRSLAVPLGMLLALELVRFAFDFAKFGKPASYHSYLAKLWGLVLVVAVVLAFLGNGAHGQALHLWWWAACVLGILSDLEGLTMSAMLPAWRRDVKTIWYAQQVREAVLSIRQSGFELSEVDRVLPEADSPPESQPRAASSHDQVT